MIILAMAMMMVGCTIEEYDTYKDEVVGAEYSATFKMLSYVDNVPDVTITYQIVNTGNVEIYRYSVEFQIWYTNLLGERFHVERSSRGYYLRVGEARIVTFTTRYGNVQSVMYASGPDFVGGSIYDEVDYLLAKIKEIR